jgi:uncharacterized protein (DUF433 family)
MSKDYVTQIEGAYRITGTRISLDSVVYAFLNGQTPESIVDSFPLLTLEQVYGAIAFYLAHRTEIDEYLQQGEAEFESSPGRSRSRSVFYRKLADARRRGAAIPIRFQADADLNQIIAGGAPKGEFRLLYSGSIGLVGRKIGLSRGGEGGYLSLLIKNHARALCRVHRAYVSWPLSFTTSLRRCCGRGSLVNLGRFGT